jgi:hypothetical protein
MLILRHKEKKRNLSKKKLHISQQKVGTIEYGNKKARTISNGRGLVFAAREGGGERQVSSLY